MPLSPKRALTAYRDSRRAVSSPVRLALRRILVAVPGDLKANTLCFVFWRLKGRMARRIKYRHVCVPPMSHFEVFFEKSTRAVRILCAACFDEGDTRCLGELFYIALRQKFYRICGR